MMTGCGLKRGVVTGATDEDGVDVIESPTTSKTFSATIFTARLALIPYAEYDLPGMPTFHRVENQANRSAPCLPEP